MSESPLHFEDWVVEHEKLHQLLATKEDLKELATRADVEDVLKVFKSVNMALKLVSTGGSKGYHLILILASLVVAVGVVVGGLKAGIAWMLALIRI